ncbi:PAS domain S-box protein [Deinococcus sp. Arct2-2]|uniref:sensor histidine kinase n=1 Tax=Deinococcus sp. Arct2-2 TaxID=2568653 RepID=UPI0010A4690D|nr:ATP-binding protein [Deinococcus sp. Arct2-2]THF68372.1 PAS domain S-box protein [Deinococcus sp. Arct2-2]
MNSHTDLQQRFEAQAHTLQIHQVELEAQNEELRQTNLELELARNQYADLFQAAPVGYVVCDSAGTIQQINALGCAQLGSPEIHLIGRPFALFVDPTQRPHLATLLNHVWTRADGPHRTELQMHGSDGRWWQAQLECTSLHTPAGWRARMVLTDVTALKSAQQEADERRQEAQSLNAELQTFLRALTQDLTGPQRQIQGFAQFLKDSLTPADVKSAKVLQHLLEAASDLGTLTTALTEFFQSTQPSTHRTQVNLNHLVSGLAHDLEPEWPGREVKLTYDSLPTIWGSPQQLRLIFKHLLSNAVKFTGPRPEAQIHVGVQEHREAYVFSVRDNGVGFDPAQNERLFTLFGRLHRPRDFKGQGLGLALVKRIVQHLHGQVWADSVPGEGAVFWVQLPKPEGAVTPTDSAA